MKYFTNEECTRIFDELKNRQMSAYTEYGLKIAVRNEALFRVMYYCALRVSEVINLKLDDYILFRDEYNRIQHEIHCTRVKKGNNNTLRLLDRETISIIQRHISLNKPTDYLFVNFKTGRPLSRKTLDFILRGNVKKHIVGICEAAKIQDSNKWHCHTFRHTRAIQLADDGLDLKELQYWLGHSRVENTLIYFEFTSNQQRAMYQKLEKKEKERRKKILHE